MLISVETRKILEHISPLFSKKIISSMHSVQLPTETPIEQAGAKNRAG